MSGPTNPPMKDTVPSASEKRTILADLLLAESFINLSA
jgi:hypothetical protein